MTPEQRIRAEVERILEEHQVWGFPLSHTSTTVCHSDNCKGRGPCDAHRLALMVKAAVPALGAWCRSGGSREPRHALEAMAAFLGEEGES